MDAHYEEAQRFYARQMQLLDSGATDEWAGTFTDDGVFEVGDTVVRGAGDIAEAARKTAAQFAAAGITRRHWIGMLAVRPHPEGLTARSYALVLEIAEGGDVVPRRSTVCADLLVGSADGWRVKHRRITRDGMDPG
ncbi:nuclear transport factor 2 family protein [Nonomuraea sp. MCN248]|uniref:Nuclear transport factor 2 family protein n=1 Tax=Nonomuraea corallina TaxID=2989783 RepID=A0ABT4S6F6_9ACTN|nr:nuclear transport factor 2 family protein [Nonomuraea corallina]MDA0632762.1 nuclear transport factor 2 family protein [Nonomuraea corallina]